ncbi:hypothetical protein COLO4_22852 [Corchorus olitorius]|uniref:Uncharacterized protein n=1 Tax=Corchorus olitorius TaxID=93759 RepID=A0A1R3IJI2_9ROSI|nr:hypothetical protein COLO4_22852 [Corchorus olitorius]
MPFSQASPFFIAFSSNIFFSVGCGDRINFWHDAWSADTPLKDLFPRIFALSSLRDGFVVDYGGLAPPKVEAFIWQAARDRIAVRDFLAARGLIDSEVNICPFCNSDKETVHHLLFSYKFSWTIWSFLLNLWGLNWVMPGNASGFLCSWHEITLQVHNSEALMLLAFVVSWSLWLDRNEKVFKGKDCNVMGMVSIISRRYALWIKARWPDIVQHVEDIFQFPHLVLIPPKAIKTKIVKQWQKPAVGCLKFNVDGFSLGKPGDASIDVLAVKEALSIYSTSCWAQMFPLTIESDSSNTVKWVKDPSSAPWRFRQIMMRIELFKQSLGSWDIVLIPRSTNSMADGLAKQGVCRNIAASGTSC